MAVGVRRRATRPLQTLLTCGRRCPRPRPQVEGLGIASAAQLFTDFGYQRRDPYEFPSKKLRVRPPLLPHSRRLPRAPRPWACSAAAWPRRRRADLPAHPACLAQAYWFSPPDPDLPRVFISEVKVEELSPQAQGIIRKQADGGRRGW